MSTSIRFVQAGTAAVVALFISATGAPLRAAPVTSGASTTTNASGQARGNASAAPAERRICARVELSGTRISRRVCRTQAEWNREGGLPNASN